MKVVDGISNWLDLPGLHWLDVSVVISADVDVEHSILESETSHKRPKRALKNRSLTTGSQCFDKFLRNEHMTRAMTGRRRRGVPPFAQPLFFFNSTAIVDADLGLYSKFAALICCSCSTSSATVVLNEMSRLLFNSSQY